MELTKTEIEVLKGILTAHIEEIKKNESLPNQYLVEELAEVNYEETLTGILNKLG